MDIWGSWKKKVPNVCLTVCNLMKNKNKKVMGKKADESFTHQIIK